MIKERFSDVTLVELPPMRVARFRAVSRAPEDDAMKGLTQWATGAGLRGLPRNFGFDCEVTPEQAADGLRSYELWFVAPPGIMPAGPVNLIDFPGGRFAAMTVYHPFDDPFRWIPTGWNALHEWVISHGQEQPGATQCLEELVAGDEGRDLVLYHPVKEKTAHG